MWAKRTGEELEKTRIEAKRRRKWFAVLAGAFIFVMGLFFHGIGWSSHYSSRYVTLNEIPSRIPAGVIVGVLFGWGVYRFPSKWKRTMICPRCKKNEDSETRCSCGGHYEDLESMKWV